MALWTEIVSPAELTAFSRTALDSLDDSILRDVLPNLEQDEVKFSWRVGGNVADVAEYGDFDTEATIGDGPRGEEKMARLLPVSRKLPLSEYEQISEPDRVRSIADDKAEAVVKAIVRRLMLARGEALETGQLALKENGIKQTVNFGRATNQTNQAPGTVWSGGGADPIADLSEWAKRISDRTGMQPDTLIVSTKVAAAMGAALVSAGYVSTTAPVVARALVDEVLEQHALPRLSVFNESVGSRRVIDEDKLVLAVAGGAGATVFGPTVEASDPRFDLEGEDRAGIVAGLYREDDPPMGWVLGKAVALPILSNPNATLSAKVFA